MNPADQAQIEMAKYQASQARKDAGNLMTSATENAQLFNQQAEQRLAQGMTILGKTGNLGDTLNAIPKSGVDLGSMDTPEVKALRDSVSTLQKQLDSTPESITKTGPGGEHGSLKTTTSVNPEYMQLKNQLAKVNEQLGILGTGGEVADIRNPEMLGKASGSDLLTMVSTRDAMERDKRTLMRNAQSAALSALQAGENYDKMAAYAEQAASWNTWSTILSAPLKVAGLAAGFGWNPFKTGA